MIENEHSSTFLSYQVHFIEWLTSLDDRRGAESPLSECVDAKYLNRLETYQASYLGRITANLSETLFEACENLFGKEFVTQILAGYFKSEPPRAAELTSAADSLPHLLRATNESREALLFADVADLCIRRWRILTDEDDNTPIPDGSHSLTQIFLRSTAQLLKPCGVHDLGAAWAHAAQAGNEVLPERIFAKRCSVLFGKNHKLQFQVIAVPEPFESFMQALVDGLSVAECVDIMESSLEEKNMVTHDIAEQFQSLLATLTEAGLLKAKL